MAQRTGAERFLAPLAKVASAGLIPALVVVATMGFSGCGDSSGDARSTASATQASSTRSEEGAAAKAKAPSPAEEEQRMAAAKVKAASEKGNAGSGKKGPAVSTPKGEQEPGITPEQRANATVADIALSSPAMSSGSPLPATYTCDGKNSWPELAWQGLPAGTAEVALFMMNIQPVNEQIFFDWAVGGIDPFTGGIEAGKLPKGAVLGKNSFGKVGYSVCPPPGTAETYMFVLYALPRALSPQQGFDALALREAALKQAGNAGLMAATYSRK